MRLALILMMMAGTAFADQWNVVVSPTPNGKSYTTTRGDFVAKSVTTPSLSAKQYLSTGTYTWDEIKNYTVGGVTTTVFVDPADSSNVSIVGAKFHGVTSIANGVTLAFVQATDGNRPLTATGANGYQCLRNNAGVTSYMNASVVPQSIINVGVTQVTAFFVTRINSSSASKVILDLQDPNTTNRFLFYANNANLQFFNWGPDVVNEGSGTRLTANYSISSIYRNGGAQGIYTNGASVTEVTGLTGPFAPTNSSRTFSIMSNNSGTSNLNGDLIALIIFNGYLDPTGDEYKKIYNTIAQRFGLPAYPSTSGVIQVWKNAIGSVVAYMADTGKLFIGALDSTGASVMRAFHDADNILTVIGTSLQTGDLFRLQGRGGGVTVAYNGGVTGTSAGFSGTIQNPKSMMTTEGGYAVLLLNKTGATSSKGTVLGVSPTTNNAVSIAPANTKYPIGVMYSSGVTDGGIVWVVQSGIADVNAMGPVTLGTGYLRTGATDGVAVFDTDTSIIEHNQEIGHPLEATANTYTTSIKSVVHFN